MRVLLLAFATFALAAQPEPPTPGAVLDPAQFRYAREIAPGPAALVVLPLDAAVLAHSRGPQHQFSDLRIVDSRGRQIQYLLRQEDRRTEVPVTFESVAPPPGSPGRRASAYRVRLPYAGLPDTGITIETSQRLFSRTVTLGAERPPDKRHRDSWVEDLGTSHWDGESATNVITLALPRTDLTELLVTIDEGDNSPLPITRMYLRLPTWTVRFFRPADQPLRLLYGGSYPAVDAPRYDIALESWKVLAAPAEEIAAGPEPAVAEKPAAIVPPWMFWGGLVAAVVVLLALIARLATSPSSAGPPPPSAPGP